MTRRSKKFIQTMLVNGLVWTAFVGLPQGILRANVIYTVFATATSSNPTGNPLQNDTVSGSITTDGTIGVLQSADIVSWNLQLIDGLNAANDFTLTPANSGLAEDVGGGLSASATGLSFNYSDPGAEFLIQGLANGFFSGYNYFCFSATGGACLAGETIAPDYIYTDGVVLTGNAAPVGDQPLTPQSSAPEPATLGLMGGVGAILLLKFRRSLPG